MRFFTSDTHFFHTELLGLCRPEFKDVDQMNETLVRNWNQVVGPGDEVWHLGDVSWANSTKTAPIIRCLNGTKILVMGNHDKGSDRWRHMGFAGVYMINDMPTVKIEGLEFRLSHFPYKEGVTKWHPDMYIPNEPNMPLICGHVHTAWRQLGNMLNVGVELNGYTPVSEAQVAKEFGLTV